MAHLSVSAVAQFSISPVRSLRIKHELVTQPHRESAKTMPFTHWHWPVAKSRPSPTPQAQQFCVPAKPQELKKNRSTSAPKIKEVTHSVAAAVHGLVAGEN